VFVTKVLSPNRDYCFLKSVVVPIETTVFSSRWSTHPCQFCPIGTTVFSSRWSRPGCVECNSTAHQPRVIQQHTSHLPLPICVAYFQRELLTHSDALQEFTINTHGTQVSWSPHARRHQKYSQHLVCHVVTGLLSVFSH
jgi:hypothetical protein